MKCLVTQAYVTLKPPQLQLLLRPPLYFVVVVVMASVALALLGKNTTK